MKALVLEKPGQIAIQEVPEPVVTDQQILLKVRMVGFCGSDLNSFRGLNPLISFPRILGHEVCGTVVQAGIDSGLAVGTDVAVSPYTSCGQCASCRRGRANACQFNQTLGVQRDGALTEFIAVPREKLYPAQLTRKELCLVEPLTVGFHAVARGRVGAGDIVAVLGCGGVGLGAVAASSSRGATTICVDVDDVKLELARAAGGIHTINTQRQSLHDQLQEMTEGRGPDVVIEAIGTAGNISRRRRRSRIHRQGRVHRICKRAGQLRESVVCTEGTGYSRIAKRGAGRFSGRNSDARSAEISRRSGRERSRAFGGGGRGFAILE